MLRLTSWFLSLMTAAMLLSGAASASLFAANPDPCTEDFRCLAPPTVTGTVTGDNIVCWGTEGIWTLEDVPIQGSKQKCDETPVYVSGTTTWTWVISGATSASGSGKVARYTPKAFCGSYTITFTGHTDSDLPCYDAEDVKVIKTFTVPTPPMETTIQNLEFCPGTEMANHWTITNTSDECSYDYWYYVTHASGDPKVSVIGGDDTVTVGPGETKEGDLIVKVPQTTERGVKNLQWYVFTKCEVSGGRAWTVTVPEAKISAKLEGVEICPDDKGVKLLWKVTNEGTCREIVTLDGVYDPKGTLTSVAAMQGGGPIEPGASIKGELDVTCDQASPGGEGEYAIEVRIDPQGVVATGKGKIGVPGPEGSFVFEQFVDAEGRAISATGEPGDTLTLPFTIENPGQCSELYTYNITSDNPDISIGGGVGIVFLGPGGQAKLTASVTINPNAARGVAVIVGNLTARGILVGNDSTSLEIFVCDRINPPSWTVTVLEEPAVCIGSSKPDSFTIVNTSGCPGTISWKAEQISGPPSIEVSKASGSVSVPKFASVDVPITIFVPLESKSGDGVVQITTTDQYGNQKKTNFTVSAYKLIGVTHNRSVFSRYTSQDQVTTKLKVEGNHKDNTFTYQLINVEKDNSVQWSKESSALSYKGQILEPGRYVVRASDGIRTISAVPVFVVFKITFQPKGKSVFKWDDNATIDEQWKIPESWTDEAIETADNLLDVADAVGAYGTLVDANVTAAKKALEESAESLEQVGQQLSKEASAANAEKTAAQAVVDAAGGKVATLEKTLDDTLELIRDIESRNPPPRPLDIRNQLKSLKGTVDSIRQTQLPAARQALKSANAALAVIITKIESIAGAITDTASRLTILKNGIARFTTILEETGAMVDKIRSLDLHVTRMGQTARDWSIRTNRLIDKYKLPFTKIPAIPIIGTVIDVIQVINLFEETEKLRTGLEKLNELSVKYQAALETLTVDRIAGPLVQLITVETTPGRLPLTFHEKVVDWKTKESPLGGRNVEKDWDWRHLTLINGDEDNYGTQVYTNGSVTGKHAFALYAYGNLGTSKLTIDVATFKDAATRDISATGATEEEMINAAEIKVAKLTDEWERVRHNVEAITTLLSAGIGVLALVLLLMGSTLAAPIAVAAAVVAVLAIAVNWLVGWLTEGPLEDAIEFNYPESNT